jgi:hypothetical protein
LKKERTYVDLKQLAFTVCENYHQGHYGFIGCAFWVREPRVHDGDITDVKIIEGPYLINPSSGD